MTHYLSVIKNIGTMVNVIFAKYFHKCLNKNISLMVAQFLKNIKLRKKDEIKKSKKLSNSFF